MTTRASGLIIVGMHRSGTSAVAQMVHRMGVFIGPRQDLIIADPTNPTGHWESWTLTAVNGTLLATCGGTWSAPPPLLPGWQLDPDLDDVLALGWRAFPLVYPQQPWVWKDPRICLTLPFWRERVIDVPLAALLVLRNPLEVAQSLHARNALPKGQGLALWERSMGRAVANLRGLPTLVLSYEDLLEGTAAGAGDPVLGLWSYLTEVGVVAGDGPPEGAGQVLVGGLRHGRYSAEDLRRDPDVSAAQAALYEVLQGLRGAHDSFSPPDLPAETPSTASLLDEARAAAPIGEELALMRSHADRGVARLEHGRPAEAVVALRARQDRMLRRLRGR
ncbi:MAG: sulfotransferase family protein [Actinomycetota bacterium]